MIDIDGFVITQKVSHNTQLSRAIQLAMNPIEYLTEAEVRGFPTGTAFVFDVESYPNLFYVAFKHVGSGKVFELEASPDSKLNCTMLAFMMWNFCNIGFYSKAYDVPIVMCAATGRYTSDQLYEATCDLIVRKMPLWSFQKKYNIVIPKRMNHVDLIEVCPLIASLKAYGGRLHCKRMQDLPFPPGTILTREQAQYVKNYCGNDLETTLLVCMELKDQLTLRAQLSQQYGIDLMSKSDAQIAEAVIVAELAKLKGYHDEKPTVNYMAKFFYKVPTFIKYETPILQRMLETLRSTEFELDNGGRPKMPPALSNLKIAIGQSVYKMGMGGLHSTEKCVGHIADQFVRIDDDDFDSFYPFIIITQQLFPAHLGPEFLTVFKTIVYRRIEAKKLAKSPDKAVATAAALEVAHLNQVIADCLKIVINGSFGKLGSPYSLLYSPDLMLQVTISGQLILFMLIERLHLAGIPTISANTDGIVTKYDRNKYETKRVIIKQLEHELGMTTEESNYQAVYSRDINNYIAVKLDKHGKIDGCKGKGAYKNPWAVKKEAIFRFHKNPETTVCIEAVTNMLETGERIETFINRCDDIRKFITVRTSDQGAYKVVGNESIYLGKAIRWYYATGEKGCINAVSNGYKIPKSDGAKPLMDLPDVLPEDINRDHYISEAYSILHDIGYYAKPKSISFF